MLAVTSAHPTTHRADIVRELHAAKAQFDPIPSQKFIIARRNANPWELIGKSVFINRAAVKMANMDALMHFQLTDPDNEACPTTAFYCCKNEHDCSPYGL